METNNWIHRRFFLSNQKSAPRLVCFNTSDGFQFGEIRFQNETLICDLVDRHQSSFQIDHLCWLPGTIFRPSRRKIQIALITLPNNNPHQQVTGIFHSDGDENIQSFNYIDETNCLTPSSIDYSEKFDKIATGYIDGIVKIYQPSKDQTICRLKLNQYGILHRLEWNSSFNNELLLLAHEHRLNIFDGQRDAITLTLNQNGHEHLADCSWRTNDLIIGRHRHHILIWDRRRSREPIRTELLDNIGQPEKLKFSRHSTTNLISLYDGRFNRIKLYDLRCLKTHFQQIESFNQQPSLLCDYHWSIEKSAIVVATHQGLLHWIDINH